MKYASISETRLANARVLKGGMKTKEFAMFLGKSSEHISMYFSQNAPKNIGYAFAREIEQVFSMPEHWLDHPHGDAQPDPKLHRAPTEPLVVIFNQMREAQLLLKDSNIMPSAIAAPYLEVMACVYLSLDFPAFPPPPEEPPRYCPRCLRKSEGM